MKVTTATALSALLLASSVAAAPSEDRRRAAAYERRMARRAARAARMPFPVSSNATMERTMLGKQSGKEFVSYDSNWAGAVADNTGITAVQATANVPSASVPPGGNSGTTYGGSAWVGIDGAGSCNVILQTGFSWDVEDGATQYAAWYEWYPQSSYDFNIQINEGDQISMSVVATSATSGTAYITNESTGQSVQQGFTGQTALCMENAEWIVEDFEENGSLIPFAEFSQVTFTNAGYTANGNSVGVSGAGIVDIEQNNQVLTNCGTSGSSQVQCSYQ